MALCIVVGVATVGHSEGKPMSVAADIAIALVEPSTDTAIKIEASFAEDQAIPIRYTAVGENVSPMLVWSGSAEGTKSYVIVVEDSDAERPKPPAHWVIYDIGADVSSLNEGFGAVATPQSADGIKQGTNSFDVIGYSGPNPPAGEAAHHYQFQIFGLDTASLSLPAGATRDAVLHAMEGHVLSEGQVVGLYAN
jgi:Raf kinase inhibitor-like YbhB/YbcL family protein